MLVTAVHHDQVTQLPDALSRWRLLAQRPVIRDESARPFADSRFHSPNMSTAAAPQCRLTGNRAVTPADPAALPPRAVPHWIPPWPPTMAPERRQARSALHQPIPRDANPGGSSRGWQAAPCQHSTNTAPTQQKELGGGNLPNSSQYGNSPHTQRRMRAVQ
jgi:hypothetical protein